MYKRFIRWASDRLADDGIIAFITNRAYLETRQDDGFRRLAAQEFSNIYIMDLGSDVRRNPKISGTKHNVFGIQTGVAIAFFVRNKDRVSECRIGYARRDDAETAVDKLAYLRSATLDGIKFDSITPDKRNDWLNQSTSDFEQMIPAANRETKLAKTVEEEQAVFGLYSLGISTNRDEWVYDFDGRSLRVKALFFADAYNELLDNGDSSYPTVIKWSRDLRNEFQRGRRIVYNDGNRIQSLYRPFVIKHHFVDFTMNDVLTNNHYQIFGSDLRQSNKVVCFLNPGGRPAFSVLATDRIPSLALFIDGTQCLPLYRYTDEGERVCNITEWGLRQFREHYDGRGIAITAERIFAYTYGVLHDPVYRENYAVDLLREFPRLPLYDDFDLWANMGQELLDLHIGFERVEQFALDRRDANCEAGKARLRADRERGLITLDERTTLAGVPPEAWEYRLGSRSALEWVLDQYKEKKPRDPTIRERFNTYRFADHKEKVIDLLQRVCTVSVRTMEIVEKMERLAER